MRTPTTEVLGSRGAGIVAAVPPEALRQRSTASRDAAPADTPAPPAPRSPYRLFEVTGLELEYAVVDGALEPRCLVEDAFRILRGRPTSDVAFGNVGFSNELAAHVFEMKTIAPVPDLAAAEAELHAGLQRFLAVLRRDFQARLLPTAMHPWMRPQETQLWRRSGRPIYETYARLFSIHEHGWLNVQSCQINLPFGTEAETVLLHNAIACLLPYLPALAASSPVVEGVPGASLCNRMAFYATNQRRFPSIAGCIVPEYMMSFAQYRRDVFAPIYRDLAAVDGTERIRHEFVNSRGAILRFNRRAIEIRVIDLQECVRMDVALAVLVRLVAKRLVALLQEGRMRLPEHGLLVEDYAACVARGRAADVQASHVFAAAGYRPGAATAEAALLAFLDLAHHESEPGDAPYLRLVEERIRTGNLAERILHATALERRSGDEGRAALRRVYEELVECLEKNEPWRP